MTDEIKRPTRPRDANQLAKSIVDIATGEASEEETSTVIRARKGGLEGGRARAASLSKERRSEIARNAANSRWVKQNSDQE